jgi:lipoprotein NlpD
MLLILNRQCLQIFVLLTVLLFAACSTAPAPVDSRRPPPSTKIKTHVVGKGETLFSIAWAYGFDYKALARANGIDQSYVIHPGQVLKLTDVAPSVASTAAIKTNSQARASATKPQAAKPLIKNVADSKLLWRWPAPGKVMRAFSESGSVNKGIDLVGNLGDPVYASASGRVVYAGSGLLGYGQLIIIKHNDQFLSAYAHNRILSVKEGDDIKGGQKIAEIGASGADKVKLHFEIRRDGKPVDPELYLPRR